MYLWLKLVSDAPHRLDVARIRRIALDLFAQAMHVHRHRAGIDIFGQTPHQVEQLVAVEHLARVPCQDQQQIELFRCQRPKVRACSSPSFVAPMVRRSTALTRLTSSRGLNGLTT